MDTTTPTPRIAAVAASFALALALAACSPQAATETPVTDAPAATDTDTDTDTPDTTTTEPTVPSDFPADYIPLPDGELVAASGGDGSWTLSKHIQLVDQARVAAENLEKSYGFTIDEFVDGDSPSWSLSSDTYVVVMSVTDGDQLVMSVQVDAV